MVRTPRPRVLVGVLPALSNGRAPASHAGRHVYRGVDSHGERDGRLNARLRPMPVLETDRTASVIVRGHAFVQNIRRAHFELGAEPAMFSYASPNSQRAPDLCADRARRRHAFEQRNSVRRIRLGMLRRVMFIAIKNAPDGHVDRMRERMSAAPDNVEGVRASTVHDALPVNNSSWTFVWQTDFDDQAALDTYRDHPFHVEELIPLFTSIEFEAATAFVTIDV